MAAPFFYDPDDTQYPPVLKSCVQVYLKYLADLLYHPLPLDQRYKRLIQANIQTGGDTVSRYNIDKFKKTNLVYPFTAYNLQEQMIDDIRLNHFGRSGRMYIDSAGAYVRIIPYKIEIPLISFFTSANDYYRVRTILQKDAADLTRFSFPIRLNGALHATTFNVDMGEGPTKGEYAFEFDRYLRENSIYDVVHTVTLEYNEIILDIGDYDSVNTKELTIETFPDDFVVGDLKINKPEITGISVKDDSTEVPLQPVQIQFSEPMLDDESYIRQSIYITPHSEIEYSWNSDRTILSVQPEGGFQPNTVYVLDILPYIKSELYVDIDSGLSINFKTGG